MSSSMNGGALLIVSAHGDHQVGGQSERTHCTRSDVSKGYKTLVTESFPSVRVSPVVAVAPSVLKHRVKKRKNGTENDRIEYW
jgi:hypothetical protein